MTTRKRAVRSRIRLNRLRRSCRTASGKAWARALIGRRARGKRMEFRGPGRRRDTLALIEQRNRNEGT